MQANSPNTQTVHPFIVTLPRNTSVYEGDTAMLSCGTNQPRVQYRENFLWLRNSATIEHLVIDHNDSAAGMTLRRVPQSTNQRSELRVLTNGTLQLTNAQLVDAGMYTCVLWIDGKSDSASAFLTVKPLAGGKNRDSSTVQNGQHHGQSPIRANRHGSNTGVQGRGHTSGTPTDNLSVGEEESKEAELVPPSRAEVSKLSETSAMLTWSVPDDTGLPVTFFKVQYKELLEDKQRRRWRTIDEDIPSHVRQFEVMSLKPGSTYRFRIVAVYSNNDNKHGPNSRKFTMSSSADLRPKVPLDGPVIVEARPISESTIALKWQYVPEEWTALEGFTVYYQMYGSHEEPRSITVHGAHVRDAEIKHLLPNTVYSIKMKGFNLGGESQFSNTVVKRTLSASHPDEYDYKMYPEFGKGFHGDGQSLPTNWPALLPGSYRPPMSSTGAPPGGELETSLNTEESNRMLYIILGCVLGILVICLLFFMAVCAWKQQQRARLFAERNKFQDQARTIYTEEAMRQKQMNGNGFILTGLNGFSSPSSPITNGHIPTLTYQCMNITSNPLVDDQSSVAANHRVMPNSNNVQCVHQTSSPPSPVSDGYDAQHGLPSGPDTGNSDPPGCHMSTFGRSRGVSQHRVPISDHLYEQPPEYQSIGSHRSRDRDHVTSSPQLSTSSSYRVHDPQMTDHIPRSHEHYPPYRHPEYINQTTPPLGQQSKYNHNSASSSRKHQRRKPDDNTCVMKDESTNTDNESTPTQDDLATENLHSSCDSGGHSASNQCEKVSNIECCRVGEEKQTTGEECDQVTYQVCREQCHSDSERYHDLDSDRESLPDTAPSVPHVSCIPRLHDYPPTDTEDQ